MEQDADMTRTMSYDSVASTLCDASSMVTAPTRRSDGSDKSSTPTENLDDTRLYLRSMKAQLEIMECKCAKLEEENANLRGTSRARATETDPGNQCWDNEEKSTQELLERISLLEGLYQDYKDENASLKHDLRNLQESSSKQVECDIKILKGKYGAAERLCEELMSENEKLKQEVFSLQQEIDEMQDQYREEETEEFRELQRELEQTAKNCRILQFKLRKAERRNDQTEADRQQLEERLQEILAKTGLAVEKMEQREQLFPAFESDKRRDIEAELRMAKEVSVRLHGELELLEEKRRKYEDENFCLKERIRELENREKLLEQMRFRSDQRRLSGANGTKATNEQTFGTYSNESLSHEIVDIGANQLVRDLHDSMERETDLKEQLRFAEDDLSSLRRKVSDLETENEVMMRQLAKVSSGTDSCASRSGGSRPPMTRSYSEGHAQIELELAEHEAEVLKTKLYQSEQENARLIAHIAKLEKESTKLRSASASKSFTGDEFYAVVPDTYYRQKTKVLEQEIEEMKAKLGSLSIEADQNMAVATDNVELKGEVTNEIQRNSSNSRTVDISRKMHLIEEELEVIRERNMLLENENERLIKENRRFSLATNSRSYDLNEDRVSNAGKLRRQASSRFSQIDSSAGRFSERISDLEKENALLRKDLARRKRLESIRKEESQLMNENIRTIHVNTASQNELRDRVTELLKENVVLTYELQVERRKNREFENQLDDYREAISQPTVQPISANEKEQEMSHSSSQMACIAAELNNGFSSICEDVCRLLATLRNAQLPMVEVAEIERRFGKKSETFLHNLHAFIGHNGHNKTDVGRQSENVIHEKLQLANDERHAAQQKCEAATVRLLQTEDRWNKELEKLKESYENQLRGLKYSLEESEKAKEESRSTAREYEAMLGEKSSRVLELERKQKQLSSEFNLRYKELQDRTESDRKRIKELELKCQNSENLLEAQRKKLMSEQKMLEAELNEHKKRLEETQAELSCQKDQAERKQTAWGRQKIELENTIKLLQTELSDFDRKAAKKAADIASAESQRLHVQLEQLKRQAESEKETILQERNDAERKLADYKREAVASAEQYERTKEELSLVKSRVSEQRQQLQDTRKQRDDYRDELGRLQQNWSREKSDLVHKLRQEEKVQQAEQQALRLKYEGRIKVMEDTAKRTQSQAGLRTPIRPRRERDNAKESLQAMEKKKAELKTKHDEEIQELKKQLEALQKENEAVENVKAQLASKRVELDQLNQTVRNERDLWTIEKKHLQSKMKVPSRNDFFCSPFISCIAPFFVQQPAVAINGSRNSTEESEKEKLLAEAIEMAAKIRIQMDELKKKHDKEIQNLKDRCKAQRHDWAKEREKLTKRVKEVIFANLLHSGLAEDSLRILNIDFQNLLSKEEEWQNEKNCLQSECDTLITYTQDFEIRMLANKYKLDRVAEQLKYLNVKLDNTESMDDTTMEVKETVHVIYSQIRSVRDDLSKTRELDKAVKNLQLNSDRYEKMIGGSSVESEMSGTSRAIIRSSLDTAKNDSRTSKPVFPRTASSESNYSSTTLNRLRSPSPSPRKITTYPEAPPSIILNTQKLVEYDKEGKRHWVRRSMCRSISLDPMSTLKNPLIFEDNKRETPLVSFPPGDRRSHLRSSSTDAKITQQVSSKTRDISPMTDNCNESSDEKTKGKRQSNFFASLSRGQVRERRQRFEKNRTASVESSEIGQTIGSLGMQVSFTVSRSSIYFRSKNFKTCLAAMGASSDVEKILHRRPEGDKRSPRSNSASRFLNKIRGRSTSREAKRTVKQQFSSDISEVEFGSEQDEDKSEKNYGCFNASALRRSKLKNVSADTR
ncbi:Surface antigen repeat family protein [Trichuris trichiura]|uniref:Surface antigen repeat family protein n=1 Tax=Trichuris trichiura TaxID=36087 RepID=A0A077Z0L6_TRITR|nr:Surface antigen repeat family protein [Trichuris trichiura]